MDKYARLKRKSGYNRGELNIPKVERNTLPITMKQVSWIATLLMVVGAINWGLVGVFDWNLVSAIFGSWPTVEMIVYLLVGLSGIWGISLLVPKKSSMGGGM